jgi:NTP pyrophosphatase (non-canonical NTP hydrolase)
MDAQNQVTQNTADRGYRDGWTAEQFAARQVCKLIEELGELARCFWLPKVSPRTRIDQLMIDLSGEAKWIFDDDTLWDDHPIDGVGIASTIYARSELADLQVVVFNLAAALAEITGEPFDVVQAAVDKSTADVKRGVR